MLKWVVSSDSYPGNGAAFTSELAVARVKFTDFNLLLLKIESVNSFTGTRMKSGSPRYVALSA
ncbi:hypothetical protein D3C72_1599810 [compost metagenome]